MEASFLIKIQKEDYQPCVAKKLREYKKKVLLKGFRSGTVPQTLLQQMYGPRILMEQIEVIVHNALEQCLKENKLILLGEPIPEFDAKELAWDHSKRQLFLLRRPVINPRLRSTCLQRS